MGRNKGRKAGMLEGLPLPYLKLQALHLVSPAWEAPGVSYQGSCCPCIIPHPTFCSCSWPCLWEHCPLSLPSSVGMPMF